MEVTRDCGKPTFLREDDAEFFCRKARWFQRHGKGRHEAGLAARDALILRQRRALRRRTRKAGAA